MYKFNGEKWYKAPVWYKRLRKWFIWIGGWEKPNCTGWHFRIKETVPLPKDKEICIGMNRGQLTEFLKDRPHKTRTVCWLDPTPISFFGHRITIQSFGIHLSVRSGWIVCNWKSKKCYISKNGTPQDAYCWFFGTPKDILDKVKNN